MKRMIAMVVAMVAGVALAEEKQVMDKDAIINGVHGYMPDNYTPPSDPLVRERLEWLKDQKLALMMHWGIYSQIGIVESWALCDKEASWSRQPYLDWLDWRDGDAFKKQYLALNRSFNPVRFQPELWAALAKDNGFRYLVFTTKHHDGFCMYDSKYSDYKVTAPECPFSRDPRADIVKNVFEAFRTKGLGIVAYFSKPDWHHPDYWAKCGVGYQTTRMPSYDVAKDPVRWARFREYTKNQLLELVRDYGPIDALWLDGGQVQRKCGLDINIEEIVAEARKIRPGLISVDRTAGGTCEDVITPEQTVPPEPLSVPWESCITMGTGFSYRFDDTYKSPRELVTLLVDIVAKGGNLALNVAPAPDGRLPIPAVRRMQALGAWLGKNGKAIYATRPTPPFRKDAWAYTQSKDGKVRYAIGLWEDLNQGSRTQAFALPKSDGVTKVTHLATGVDIPFEKTSEGLVLQLPLDLPLDPIADAFELR